VSAVLYNGRERFAEFAMTAGPAGQTVSVYMKREDGDSVEEMIMFSVYDGRLIFKLNSAQGKGNMIDAKQSSKIVSH